MPEVIESDGDIFASGCEALVSPVDTTAAQGKGLALQFVRRFPVQCDRYTKLGAQRIPEPGHVYHVLPKVGDDRLSAARWVLERGARMPSSQRRVYTAPSERAAAIAADTHPAWERMKPTHRPLHARNSHQVLGANCDRPAAFTLCWTPDGAVDKTSSKTGGTGQAIRVSVRFGVPVWNLQRPEHREMWERLVV